MKVLWLCNVPIPEASNAFNLEVNNAGGWMVNLASLLSEKLNIELHIAFIIDCENEIESRKRGNYTFWKIKSLKNEDITKVDFYNNSMSILLEEINPDVIHIWGTEHLHSLSMINCAKKLDLLSRTVLSIQGLVSVYAQHYYANVPEKIVNAKTLRDVIKQDSIKKQKKQFERRSLYEIEAINKVNNIIGRTDWDLACTQQINSNIKYYSNNEILREIFYNASWNIKQVERYSIFMSQGAYPIKGLHQALVALSIVKKKYSKVKLYVAGQNILSKNPIYMSSYHKYIKNLISSMNLQDNVVFTGNLNETEMCERYLKSNVFISPAVIENSPNSLGEAMLLGTPVISSDVGGVKNMLIHNEEGYIYPFDEPYMLAHYICQIFSDDQVATKISEAAKKHASLTHDKNINVNKLMNIYSVLS